MAIAKPPEPAPTPATAPPTHEDLDAAYARLGELRALVEVDSLKVRKSQTRRAAVERRLRIEARAEGVPYDPAELPAPYDGDRALHKKHHAQHYEVARIERALDVRQPTPDRSGRDVSAILDRLDRRHRGHADQ